MKFSLSRIVATLGLASFIGLGVFSVFHPHVAFAATTDTVSSGLATVGDAAGLVDADPRIIVARLIRTALTFLGVLVVCIIVYGGFVWMTAGGEAERVDRAKKILINAVIGLVIILMSWSITAFVISSLTDAINGSSGSSSSSGGYSGSFGGGGSSTSFTVTGFSPTGAVTIRNIVPRITFSKAVDSAKIDGNISITDSTGTTVPGAFSLATTNVIKFIPSTACPTPNETLSCFAENETFTITVKSSLTSTGGSSLVCSVSSCSSTFTSGSLVDTEDPIANVLFPTSSISVNASTDFQVQATDDAGVAGADFLINDEWQDSISAVGNPLDTNLSTNVSTSGFTAGTTYTFKSTVTDLAGHEGSDTSSVRARPEWCFNGTLDSDLGETGVDCGGDASSANYCGACNGGACTTNSDCSEGSCVNNVCVANPTISSVTPNEGAVGTYVTLSGKGFGSSVGNVFFTDAAGTGTVAATILTSCGDGGWKDTQVLVQVPTGAGDGPITLTTNGGASDKTDDSNGAQVLNFDVNDVVSPSLCSLSSSSGVANSALTLSGGNFGASQGSSTVSFGTTPAGSYTFWGTDGTSAKVTVPSAALGTYNVSMVVNGKTSNTLSYSITEAESAVSTITGISPSSGGIGQYVTITGTNFGSSVGTVTFKDASGNTALGSILFPAACSTSFWSSDQVTIIVPDKFQNGDPFTTGAYSVSITNNSSVTSSSTTFTVNTTAPTPGICAITPSTGNIGDAIVIDGANFGSTLDTVTFTTSGDDRSATSWNSSEVKVNIPSGAVTGPVTVKVAGVESNRVNLAVGSAGTSTAAATVHAAYAWDFSTGDILDVPEVVSECTLTPEDAERVSAVPNSAFSTPEQVCVNAIVHAEFTELMNDASVEDAITVKKCAGTVCSTLTDVKGTAVATDTGSFTSVDWTPEAEFEVNTTYKVTIAQTAISAEAVPLNKETTWDFTTAATTAHCVVDRVTVSPSDETFTQEGQTMDFGAEAGAGCVDVKSADYTWSWSLDKQSYVGFTGTSVVASTTLEALAEGSSTLTATVIAPNGSGNVSDDASVVVNFTDPYISEYWPDCTEACTNAEVGASFSTAMNRDDITAGGNIVLKECTSELCTAYAKTVSTSVECIDDNTDPSHPVCVGFSFGDTSPLTTSKFYRVVVSGAVRSTSGVALIRANYGSDYSWTFRVREDATLCAVERITMSPSSPVVASVGDATTFTVSAFGAADSCSVSGQALVGSTYDWSWTNPILNWDQTAAQDSASSTIAAWYSTSNPGKLLDGGASKIVTGCSAMCTPLGSEPSQSICGNSVKEIGEECDDGNTKASDGCSSSCLDEGAPTCPSASDRNCCGNGAIETDSTKNIRENCDDGNTVSGDGCSSACLAEGSASIGATCGNSDIAHKVDASMDGETCDDGNNADGDGCSRQCLLEGSSTLAALGGALCGDGKITTPYETCDDGALVDGDGCSSTCIREGFAKCASATSTNCCGNSVLEQNANGAGEDCDGTEGCTSTCTYAGSSTSYGNPSVCGDGTTGTGEYASCESGSGIGDGNVDPDQVAFMTSGAVKEVDPTTHQAIADVTVTLSSQTPVLQVSSHFALTCDAQSDADCSDPENYGVGTNNCCVNRPTFTGSAPASAATNVCRNAAISATFSEEMDIASFTEKTMYAVLNLASGQTCPSTYTVALDAGSSSWFAKVLAVVKTFFLGEQARAAYPATGSGTCILPVDSYTQEGNTVSMNYGEALEPNSSYTLFIEGDQNTGDETTEGVHSSLGAAMKGTTSLSFSTGVDVCTLDEVITTDTNTESPNLFTVEEESHDFVATGWSHTNGTSQEITSLDGVYSWGYSDWTSADTTVFTVANSVTDTAAVTAQGVTGAAINGTTDISVTATIVDGFGASEAGSIVSSNATVTAFLCENTWPELAQFPWSDDATGVANGFASELPGGYMNMTFSYCRDQGESSDKTDDLPKVTPVIAPVSPASDVLKEYLFEVEDGSGDAIGVRVLSNADYLSPKAWYESKGFTGSPSSTTVDGFEAVTDGRTTYVAAANVSGTSMYSNIIAVSYNESASEETQAIYAGMLASATFLHNVANVAFCYTNGVENTNTCSADSDCPAEEITAVCNTRERFCYSGTEKTTTRCASNTDCADVEPTIVCGNDKDKITRDAKRLEDSRTIAAAVSAYGTENGTCSATTAQTCTESSECPGTETCEAIVPTLASGTDIRSLSSSAWGSWTQTLGGAIGTLPTDPLNTYAACLEGDNAATCVNETTDVYTCPENSYVYHYRAVGDRDFEVGLQLEYRNGWANAIDSSTTDSVTYAVNTYCNDTAYGASSSCGDGIIGTNATTSRAERCEIGDVQAKVCTTEDGLRGAQNDICNDSCTGYVADSTAVCTAGSCGDGVINNTETCDDGSANGTYGHCSSTCSWTDASSCGDGVISGGEACDCGNSAIWSSSSSATRDAARPYGGAAGSCMGANGTYAYQEAKTCSWDCKAPASYCGDGVTDSGEACDGEDVRYEGKLCNRGTRIGKECSSDSDCGGTIASCGGISSAYGVCSMDGLGTICIQGATENIGKLCSESTQATDCGTNEDTGASGVCSTEEYSVSRVETCLDDSANGEKCTLSDPASVCTSGSTCGDSVVDANEECDDGNDVSTDSCTTSCKTNVCGDAYLNSGVEECDQGADNGGGCASAYESTCTACSTQCKYTISSGEYCGDGVMNGDEYCDGSEIPLLYFDEPTMTTNGTCAAITDPQTSVTTDSVTTTYSCRHVGVCNGGTHNGEYCTTSGGGVIEDTASCGTGGSCVQPVCATSCASTCPLSTTQSTLLMAPNDPGAPAESSVDLYPYTTISTSSIPNAATLEIPACTVASTLIADVDLSQITPPETYVVFVLDSSDSMGTGTGSTTMTDGDDIGKTKMEIMQEQVESSIEDVVNTYNVPVSHIGVVNFLMSSAEASAAGSARFATGGSYDRAETIKSFTQYPLLAQVGSYIGGIAAGGTPSVGDGLKEAAALLDTVDDVTSDGTIVRKIVIVITDGQDYSNTTLNSAANKATAELLSKPNTEIYTLGINSTTKMQSLLDEWSSNTTCGSFSSSSSTFLDTSTWPSIATAWSDCSTSTIVTYKQRTNATNGIDYSSFASPTSGSSIRTAIQNIIKSALGTTITFQSGTSTVTTNWDEITDGADIALPWPTNFVCDGVSTINVPMHLNYHDAGSKELAANGSETDTIVFGTVNISNVRMNMCSP